VKKIAIWIVAMPAVIVAGLFGVEMYKGGADKRPMSVRIHDQCVKESAPYDEVAINRCKFRVIQHHLDETLDRIERRGKADLALERAKDRF
jgi:hypothetical protein